MEETETDRQREREKERERVFLFFMERQENILVLWNSYSESIFKFKQRCSNILCFTNNLR